MNRIWLMAVLSMKDSLRAKVWIPFVLGILAAFMILLLGFGYKLAPNAYANNIISSYFLFFSVGTYLTGIILGATTMPLERKAAVLFTLPISRTEIVVGKLLGNQIIVGCGLVGGYLASLSLALHYDLTGFSYSVLGLATAFTVSFTYLCLSIPLGFWMSSVPTVITAWLIVNVPSSLKAFVDQRSITSAWLVKPIEAIALVAPGQINPHPLNKGFYNAFVEAGAYLSLARALLLALLFFILLLALAQRKELSTKS